ncbi:MAG: transporter substrate-binding domain-containing protein [Hyphomicrobiaceae bacterium]
MWLWAWTFCAVALLIVFAGETESRAQTLAEDRAVPRQVVIRFATTDDFPPFNARDDDGSLVGFNVDLARALCIELEATCDVTPYPWASLFDRLDRDQSDAVIASHRITSATLQRVDFTQAYFHTPGRFAVRRTGPSLDISPSGLDRTRIAVARDTRHAAFIDAFFRTSRISRFDTPEAARNALKAGEVDALFDDGTSLVFWINGTASEGCCDLAGGAYLEPRYFGDGIAIAVKKGNVALRQDLDRAIDGLHASGRMIELMQRYFPRQVF